MTLIVSDTGPLLHLAEAQALDLLNLAGEVHVPRAVAAELGYFAPTLVPTWSNPDWLHVDALAPSYATEATSWQQASLLDIGESEAVALARQLQADWLLTDDAAARLLAEGLGLEVHGSLGIVLWACVSNQLDRVTAEETLDKLARSSLWISAKVLSDARTALDRLFEGEARIEKLDS